MIKHFVRVGISTLLLQGATLDLKTAKSEFLIDNATSIVAERIGAGKFTAKGTPVQMYWKDRGITGTAASVEGESGIDDNGDYFVKSANMSGGAALTLDSDAAYSFSVQAAQAAGTQPPAASLTKTRLTFSSDTLAYAGDPAIGTLTIPGAFHGTLFRHGIESTKVKDKVASRVFDDNLVADGVNASIELLAQAAEGKNPLRKGTVMGPVTFKFTRSSAVDGAPEPDTVVSGTADRMDVDFLSAEHTVTFTGNVKVDGAYRDYSANATAARAVLVFGAHDELLRIRMEGSNDKPTDGTIKPRPNVGGGGR